MENPNIIESTELDPMSLLKQAETEETATEAEATAPAETEPELTPLERAKLEKEKRGLGVEIDKETFDDGSKPKVFKDVTQSPETEAGVEDALAEMDAMIAAAEANPGIGIPDDPVAKIELMNKLADEGRKIRNGEQSDPIKTPAETADVNETNIPENEESTEEAPDAIEPIIPADSSLVNIIIDKTGLGANFDFTDEERAKMTKASKIRIIEVEDKELKAATFNRVGREESFLSRVEKYDLCSVVTPITLPASRYRCRMRGMSFGEMSDIGLDPQTVTYDLLNKRFSVLYNNMIDTSVGKFATYEEFLKNTSYLDFEMIVFGMACSTLPEDDTITLTCQRSGCGKEYDANYSPRALIRWDECDERLLKAVSTVCDAANDPEKAKEVYDASAVHNVRSYKLPFSNIVVDFGVVSMWDFLHGVANIILDPDFEKKYPGSLEVTQVAAQTLTVIRAISIPTENGEYDLYTKTEDIFEIVRKLSPQDFSVILNIFNEYTSAYFVPFTIRDSKCPHCGHVSKRVNIPIRQLVFMKLQTLGATEHDLINAVII